MVPDGSDFSHPSPPPPARQTGKRTPVDKLTTRRGTELQLAPFFEMGAANAPLLAVETRKLLVVKYTSSQILAYRDLLSLVVKV